MKLFPKHRHIMFKTGGFLVLLYIGMLLNLQRFAYVSVASGQSNGQSHWMSYGTGKSNTRVSDTKEIYPQVDIDLFLEPPKNVLLLGKRRARKGIFTIGIPSAHRPNAEKIYLYDTLDSLINKTSDVEQEQTVLVVMLCDTVQEYNNNVAKALLGKYEAYLNSGFLMVIQTPPGLYPNLTHVKQTFNDSRERLKWRAKQNFDFAFLMSFCRNIGDFYVQLEDDVISATGFVRYMKRFIKQAQPAWFVLEFSRLGFIGKLFRSADLKTVALHLIKHYDEAPSDLLLGTVRVAYKQSHAIHSNVSLFQHVGRFSSLKNKFMPSIDKEFKDITNSSFETDTIPVGDNPAAFVNTSLNVYDQYVPSYVYDNNMTTFFWAYGARKDDVIVTLEFVAAQNITRIVVLSGDSVTRKDCIKRANLEISRSESWMQTNQVEQRTCGSGFSKLLTLIDGDADTMATGTVIPANIKCLRIVSSLKDNTWIIIREIRVYTE